MAEIRLISGDVAFVDDEDLSMASQYRWSPSRVNGVTKYAMTSVRDANGKGRTVYMHRLIADAPKRVEVDHINCDGLDNRRANLRLASRSENACNVLKTAGRSSMYRGVSWYKALSKWEAYIMKGKKQKLIGRFESETEAALAYDANARELFGDFARLNFPGPHEQSALTAA